MLSPGAIALGALTGLGAGVIGSVPLLALGWADTTTIGGQTVLIVVGFASQILAGWMAARAAGRAHAPHGGLAALALYATVAFIALAASEEPTLLTLAGGAVVALVLGTAAGVLAQARTP